eukprot:7571839-Alexandrium_andersonii.AAC.1
MRLRNASAERSTTGTSSHLDTALSASGKWLSGRYEMRHSSNWVRTGPSKNCSVTRWWYGKPGDLSYW